MSLTIVDPDEEGGSFLKKKSPHESHLLYLPRCPHVVSTDSRLQMAVPNLHQRLHLQLNNAIRHQHR